MYVRAAASRLVQYTHPSSSSSSSNMRYCESNGYMETSENRVVRGATKKKRKICGWRERGSKREEKGEQGGS